jgi:hypothetical protein
MPQNIIGAMPLPLRVAVVTGGHGYDEPGFQRLWLSMEGIEAEIQPMGLFASLSKGRRGAYDAVVFYTMLTAKPEADGLPHHDGQPLTVLGELGETDQGIVMLHHSLFAFPEWRAWQEMTGIVVDNGFYSMGETVTSEIVAPDHPVVANLEPWTMVDETYRLAEPSAGSEVVVAYDHPRSMRSIAWCRQYGRSRVFCYQAGHGDSAWSSLGFRELLGRGIRWSAPR